MGITSEKRLMRVENEIKALKATYAIYGGLMNTFVTYGQWSVADDTFDFCVKFTPNYGGGKNIIVSGIYFKVYDENGNEIVQNNGYTMVQDGTGEVKFDLGIVLSGYDIYVQIATTVPGSFSRIS